MLKTGMGSVWFCLILWFCFLVLPVHVCIFNELGEMLIYYVSFTLVKAVYKSSHSKKAAAIGLLDAQPCQSKTHCRYMGEETNAVVPALPARFWLAKLPYMSFPNIRPGFEMEILCICFCQKLQAWNGLIHFFLKIQYRKDTVRSR